MNYPLISRLRRGQRLAGNSARSSSLNNNKYHQCLPPSGADFWLAPPDRRLQLEDHLGSNRKQLDFGIGPHCRWSTFSLADIAMTPYVNRLDMLGML